MRIPVIFVTGITIYIFYCTSWGLKTHAVLLKEFEKKLVYERKRKEEEPMERKEEENCESLTWRKSNDFPSGLYTLHTEERRIL